jgi:hypothetical protein
MHAPRVAIVFCLFASSAWAACYTHAPSRPTAEKTQLGPREFVDDEMLSILPWKKNRRAPGGGVYYFAHFNELASKQLSVPVTTVRTYCEGKGGSFVFKQAPGMSAASTAGAVRSEVAGLLRQADQDHLFGLFECQYDGTAQWSSSLEPVHLDSAGLPTLQVLMRVDDKPRSASPERLASTSDDTARVAAARAEARETLQSAIAQVKLVEAVTKNVVADTVAVALRDRLTKFSRQVSPAARLVVDSAAVTGADVPVEAILIVRTYRCPDAEILLGHQIAVCSLGMVNECTKGFAHSIEQSAAEDETFGQAACERIMKRPAAPRPDHVLTATLGLLDNGTYVVPRVERGLARQLPASGHALTTAASPNGFETLVDGASIAGMEVPLDGLAAINAVRCDGAPIYVGHQVGVCAVAAADRCAAALVPAIVEDAHAAERFLRKNGGRCGL